MGFIKFINYMVSTIFISEIFVNIKDYELVNE